MKSPERKSADCRVQQIYIEVCVHHDCNAFQHILRDTFLIASGIWKYLRTYSQTDRQNTKHETTVSKLPRNEFNRGNEICLLRVSGIAKEAGSCFYSWSFLQEDQGVKKLLLLLEHVLLKLFEWFLLWHV